MPAPIGYAGTLQGVPKASTRLGLVYRELVRRRVGNVVERLVAPVLSRWSGDASVPSASHKEGSVGVSAEFVSALRSGEVPSGEEHSNVLIPAMVETAVLFASTGQRVITDDVMGAAYQVAVESERCACGDAGPAGLVRLGERPYWREGRSTRFV